LNQISLKRFLEVSGNGHPFDKAYIYSVQYEKKYNHWPPNLVKVDLELICPDTDLEKLILFLQDKMGGLSDAESSKQLELVMGGKPVTFR